jgi:hypothetical protein
MIQQDSLCDGQAELYLKRLLEKAAAGQESERSKFITLSAVAMPVHVQLLPLLSAS